LFVFLSQYVIDSLRQHCFGFMERCSANTNSTCGYLPPRNLSTCMALDVRPSLQSVEIDLVLMGFIFCSKAYTSSTRAGVVTSRKPPGLSMSLALDPVSQRGSSTEWAIAMPTLLQIL
jgi:hypothetical protein